MAAPNTTPDPEYPPLDLSHLDVNWNYEINPKYRNRAMTAYLRGLDDDPALNRRFRYVNTGLKEVTHERREQARRRGFGLALVRRLEGATSAFLRALRTYRDRRERI